MYPEGTAVAEIAGNHLGMQVEIYHHLHYPWDRSHSRLRCNTGLPATGTIHFGRSSVQGRRRVPSPAASNMAFTTVSQATPRSARFSLIRRCYL